MMITMMVHGTFHSREMSPLETIYMSLEGTTSLVPPFTMTFTRGTPKPITGNVCRMDRALERFLVPRAGRDTFYCTVARTRFSLIPTTRHSLTFGAIRSNTTSGIDWIKVNNNDNNKSAILVHERAQRYLWMKMPIRSICLEGLSISPQSHRMTFGNSIWCPSNGRNSLRTLGHKVGCRWVATLRRGDPLSFK